MKAFHATEDQLHIALTKVNKLYENNIRLYEPRWAGSYLNFRLKVIQSGEIGSGMSPHSRQFRGAACWHVHGHFFDELFEVNPDCWVRANGKRIDRQKGNWEDYDRGSQVDSLYASEACDCEFSKSLVGHLAGRKELAVFIASLDCKKFKDVWSDYSYSRGRFLLQNCDPTLLPLFINETDPKLQKIINRRLRGKRA